MPDPIVEAIAYHENPSQCPSKKRSPLSFVYIANYLAHEFGYGPNLELDEKYMKDVGLFDRLPEWQESVLAIKNEKES